MGQLGIHTHKNEAGPLPHTKCKKLTQWVIELTVKAETKLLKYE